VPTHHVLSIHEGNIEVFVNNVALSSSKFIVKNMKSFAVIIKDDVMLQLGDKIDMIYTKH
jgi:hypothetical protein